MSLSIAALFKNEAPFFKEWIEYHRLVGVSHFSLYNNESTDDWQQALSPYRDCVTVIFWPMTEKDLLAVQEAAMIHAFRHCQTRWVAAIDVDEFLVPKRFDTVPELLRQYEERPGVEAYWLLHGTSGVLRLPEDRLMIETLRRRTLLPCWHVKTILQPRSFASFFRRPHSCRYVEGEPVRLERDEMEIGHYVHRSEEYFFQHKIQKREAFGNSYTAADIQALAALGNDIEDEEGAILRFVPALRRRVFGG